MMKLRRSRHSQPPPRWEVVVAKGEIIGRGGRWDLRPRGTRAMRPGCPHLRRPGLLAPLAGADAEAPLVAAMMELVIAAVIGVVLAALVERRGSGG
jgi:hypothetical protein